MHHRATDTLVTEFLTGPGAEDEQLEFKAKEKVETTAQRRELVKILAAMANTRGGTVIVGVGRDRRDGIIQSFDNQSEYKRDLYQTARDNTEPALTDYLTIDFDDVRPGASVLRIDVDQVETIPIKVDVDGHEGLVAYHRVGDTTKPMTVDDGVRFAERRHERRSTDPLVRTEHVHIANPETPPERLPDQPANRVITTTGGDSQIVLGPGVHYDGYDQAVVFDVEATVGFDPTEGVPAVQAVLDAAEDHLNADLGREFGYSISQGARTLMGKHVDHFYRDLHHLEAVVTDMLGGHPRGVSDDITHIDSLRPTIVAYTRAELGTFWLKLEWREQLQQFIRPKCGMLLGELPFDDRPLQTFFDAVDADPFNYRQHTGLQELTLKGHIPVENPIPLSLEPTTDFVAHVLAANPFYGKADQLQQQLDDPLPRHYLSDICSITHLPMFNRGPAPGGDETVVLRYLDVTYQRSPWATLFLDAVCAPESD